METADAEQNQERGRLTNSEVDTLLEVAHSCVTMTTLLSLCVLLLPLENLVP